MLSFYRARPTAEFPEYDVSENYVTFSMCIERQM